MSNKKKIRTAIIDYKMGNLFSVQHACRYVGMTAEITSDRHHLFDYDSAILPGVGAFGKAMTNLHQLDLVEPVKDFIQSGRPFMGVCLGLQLLFTESEEFGSFKGLGIIEGLIKRFPVIKTKGRNLKIPQIGWNRIIKTELLKSNKGFIPFKDIKDGEFMYFVHSFYPKLIKQDYTLTKTFYGDFEYSSSILKDNVFATQFHPEKSSIEGIKIYKNWFEYIKERSNKNE